ncbi:MAG: NADAR family protein [Alteromonadaceae bacterium]|nr:NADAR family protein [Alteromonadaceae bacterium]
MFQRNTQMENAYRFSRFDTINPLSSCSPHPIVLEEQNWLTCEHYVQAKILRSPAHAKSAASMASAELAIAYAKPWFRRKVNDYKKMAPILMTRALYTKIQMYDEVKQALLAVKEPLIVEGSQYDYFWGIGRDQRGENHLGKIWMNIRDKIQASDL